MQSINKYLIRENILYGLASLSVYNFALKPLLKSISFMYKQWLRPRRNFLKRYGKNSWAVVTGSTNGIGEQFAYQLAQLGFNIVLVSRSQQKLDRVKETINSKHPEIGVKIYEIDLMNAEIDDYKQLAEFLKNIDVSILVNNAGFAKFQKFGQGDVQNLERMVKTNTGPYCYLTHFMLPQLSRRHSQKRSAIIFVSSGGADIVLPFFSTYVATKSFNSHFAKCLSYELQEDKIDILSVKPMSVTSGLNPDQPSGIRVVSSAECVRGSLDKLGYDLETKGSWKHQLYFNRNSFISSLVCGFSIQYYVMKKRFQSMQREQMGEDRA